MSIVSYFPSSTLTEPSTPSQDKLLSTITGYFLTSYESVARQQNDVPYSIKHILYTFRLNWGDIITTHVTSWFSTTTSVLHHQLCSPSPVRFLSISYFTVIKLPAVLIWTKFGSLTSLALARSVDLLLAIGKRADAVFLLKCLAEVVNVRETSLLGDFFNQQGGLLQQLAGFG